MSRLFLASMFALTMVIGTSVAADGDKSECLKSGDPIGAFYVTKVAGAEGDGVEQGQDLCYRCRYGSRPMVMIFARDTDGKVADLIKQLDDAVAKNQDSQLKGLLTLLGDDTDKLKVAATKLAENTSAKHVPITVAKDAKTGPLNYRIPSGAAVTVVVATDSQVVSTKTSTADSIDIAAILTDVKGMLN